MVLDPTLTDRALHALADPTRRDILRRSARGEHSVSALARAYPMSLTGVQKHVTVLERAGLVHKLRRGRETVVIGNPGQLVQVRELLEELEQLWQGRIERIQGILDEKAAP